MSEEAVSLATLKQTIQKRPRYGTVDSYIIAIQDWANEIEACVEKLQKQLEAEATTGETIQFAIYSLDKASDWKKKHNIQDMKFIPLKRVLGEDNKP